MLIANRILFTAPCCAELQTYEVPDMIPDGQVLVKTAVSTVSPGTERAVISDSPNCNGYQEHAFPRQSGYSSAGVVVKTGKDVSSVHQGDRVIVYWGKHSAYNLVPENQTIKIPDEVSFEEAALVFICTFSLAALRKCRFEIGESALVMGCGLLGQFAVRLLNAAGAAPLIAVDPIESRRNEALESGADYAFDPFQDGAVQEIKRLTEGGAHVVIEVTGVGAGLDGALDCTARFGRVALLGCTRSSDFGIDFYHKVHTPGITLVGAHTAARPGLDSFGGWFTQRDDILAVLRMLKCGRISLKEMLKGNVYSPADCAQVYKHVVHDRDFPTLAQFDWRK